MDKLTVKRTPKVKWIVDDCIMEVNITFKVKILSSGKAALS